MSSLSPSLTALDLPGKADRKATVKRIVWIAISALVSALASIFFGINDYASSTAALTAASLRNAQRFEAVYLDSAETKLASLRLGIDLILTNPEITGAFSRDDRETLLRLALPLFNDTLKPKYGLNQFNFWTPPAKLYLRASAPKEFAVDGSGARKTVVAANERRTAVSGMETGLGGRLTIRAMAPILDGTRLVGTVELGDDVVALLRRARAATGVEFAAGLDRKRSDEVERVVNKNTDAIQGTDVFFEYSSEAVGQLTRSIAFNARDPAGQLIQAQGRAVYVRPFVLSNFSGAPTVAVATLFDLTDAFAEAWQSAGIKAIGLFLILSVASILGLLQFQKLQEGFARIVFGERRRLQEATRELESLRTHLKDVDVAKLGYFNNLVAAVTEPLQAIAGQLSSVLPQIASGLRAAPEAEARQRHDLLGRLDFSLSEIGRLTRLVTDFRQIEVMRQNLLGQPTGTVRLAEVVDAAMRGELARYRRLPDLAITADVPLTLPSVRIAHESLRSTIAGLVGYAAQKGGHGTIRLIGSVDETGWVTLTLIGTAFATAGAPTEALLDATRQFMAQLSARAPGAEENGIMVALLLSRTIVEKSGGHLEILLVSEGGPGFKLRLPAAI